MQHATRTRVPYTRAVQVLARESDTTKKKHCPTQLERADTCVAAVTHKASGAHGLVCGEGVLRKGGVAQKGLHLAADVVGLELGRFHVRHHYVQPFHDREDLENRKQEIERDGANTDGKTAACCQLQQTRDESGDPPDRYRPARCKDPIIPAIEPA